MIEKQLPEKATNQCFSGKKIVITIGKNRIIGTEFYSHDPVNDPVTVPEINRTIASLRSEHNKYLRVFRMEQRLKQQSVAQAEPALKK